MSGQNIREAVSADAEALLAIYAPIVQHTAISFELTPPTVAQFAERIRTYGASHGWLTLEQDGQLVGYAYGTPHREREAYRYSAEVSVYVHPDWRGRGVGGALYARLFETLAARGCFHAYAGITVPNEGSMALHARAGFRHIGTFPSVGFKFGEWHDVSWWHRPLRADKPPQG